MAVAAPDDSQGAPLGGSAPIPRTLADTAVTIIHDAILSGELAPGERLRIEDLAQRLDISPMPIREALRQLDARGLVKHIPHRGAKVAELSAEDLRETMDVRLALETLAVRQAAERFTEENAEEAEAFLKEWYAAKRSKDAQAARVAHAQFHFALYAAAGSGWLMRTIRPAWENGERYRLESVDDKRMLKKRMKQHERILRFCVEHRPDAAADELYNHLVMTANIVASKLAGEELFSFRDTPPD